MPYSSSRRLVRPERNWRTRLFCPALTSTPSSPLRSSQLGRLAEAADDGVDVLGLHDLGHLPGVHLGHAARRPQRPLAVGRRPLAAGVADGGEAERRRRGDGPSAIRGPARPALDGQRAALVGPVRIVDRGLLGDDDARRRPPPGARSRRHGAPRATGPTPGSSRAARTGRGCAPAVAQRQRFEQPHGLEFHTPPDAFPIPPSWARSLSLGACRPMGKGLARLGAIASWPCRVSRGVPVDRDDVRAFQGAARVPGPEQEAAISRMVFNAARRRRSSSRVRWGRIATANPAAARILGIELDDLVGSTARADPRTLIRAGRLALSTPTSCPAGWRCASGKPQLDVLMGLPLARRRGPAGSRSARAVARRRARCSPSCPPSATSPSGGGPRRRCATPSGASGIVLEHAVGGYAIIDDDGQLDRRLGLAATTGGAGRRGQRRADRVRRACIPTIGRRPGGSSRRPRLRPAPPNGPRCGSPTTRRPDRGGSS